MGGGRRRIFRRNGDGTRWICLVPGSWFPVPRPLNLILFEASEADKPLPRSDPRAAHILDVLRRRPGDEFDAGIIDGPRGKARLLQVSDDGLLLSFEWREEEPPPLDPIRLVIGLPRPQTARKLLQEATSLGVAELDFVTTERGEPGYASSVLWNSGEWRRHLILGAQQAFSTRLPRLSYARPLAEVLAGISKAGGRLALDNYEAPLPLSRAAGEAPVTLALGPERGWSAAERDLLRKTDFRFVNLGERVLRVETACVAAVAIVKARLGLL